MAAILYLLFFLSGAAGLMYESVWTRYLGLFVGHEAYAQILVLVIFLGGMSLGAVLVSRRAEQVRSPLLVYAAIEGITGLIGLVFHPIFVASTTWAYDHAFPVLGEGLGSSAVKWGLAALLILPQSILLGTTFPLMSAGVLRLTPREPGRVLGWLYSSNSFGAAFGVLVAGFVLISRVGLPGVLATAAGLNLLVALGAGVISKLNRQDGLPRPPLVSEPEFAPLGRHDRLLLGAAFFTAIASFCYEVDWIRMLSLVLGSATHSFELMLSAFIFGLALGAFWIRRRSDNLADPLRTLAMIQIAMGLLAIATLPVYLASFHGMAFLLNALDKSYAGYLLFILARYGFCLIVMLPATFCAGMTLPLITRILIARGRGEAAIGRVYAVNTLGSILGAALAGLVLLPMLQLKGLALLGGGIDIAVGFLLLHSAMHRAIDWRTAAIATAMLGAVVLGFPFDQRLLISGVFRNGSVRGAKDAPPLLLYADGRTATVSVSGSKDGWIAMATNGKGDASLTEAARRACDPNREKHPLVLDEITQVLTSVIPLAYHPDAATAAIIGIGSGVSTHTLLASPALRDVTTIEIEPEMVRAARLFMPSNQRAFEDPRSHIVINDAKAYFAASRKRFDLIISEPSNPWVSGVSGLFTTEFYRRAHAQLAPGGIFAQWLQTYELDDRLALSVLASLDQVFPDWHLFQVGNADLLLVASQSGALPPPDWDRVAALPLLQRQFCNLPPVTGASLEVSDLAGRTLLLEAARDVPLPNSDFHPVLEQGAERARFVSSTASGFMSLADAWFNLARALDDRPQGPVESTTSPFRGQRRSTARIVQTWQTRRDPPDTLLEPTVAEVRFEWGRWRSFLKADEPPTDWRAWLYDFRMVQNSRHSGTAGWVDSTLFRNADNFATSHGAPAIVHTVLDFRLGVQGWDAARTLAAAAHLDSTATNEGWILSEELQNGALVMALRSGQREAIRQWWEYAAPGGVRPRVDLEAMILDAKARKALSNQRQ